MALNRVKFFKPGISVVFVGCLIIATGFVLFSYESQALLWHLTHGSTYQWRGLIIRVPLMYTVNVGSSRSIQILTLPGRLRAREKTPFGVISIIHAPNEAEGAEIEELDKEIALERDKQGFRLVNSRPIEVAHSPMQCQERLAENFRSYGPASIVNCQAGDRLLFVEFYGSPSLLNEAYSVVGGIQASKAN